MNLIDKTAAERLAIQAQGAATAEAIADAFLVSIKQRDPSVKAFLHVDESAVRAQAKAVSGRREARGDRNWCWRTRPRAAQDPPHGLSAETD